MMESLSPEPSLQAAIAWWEQLNDSWKQAFNEVAVQRSTTEQLPDELLLTVYTSPAHRFSGPEAPYPNMTFQLADMSGLIGLPNAEIVVVIFHKLTHIREVAAMEKLKSLFVYDNNIEALDGIENRTELVELYAMANQITSLQPLKDLVQLKSLYCSGNLFSTLDGIGIQHLDTLENFYCLPNPNLKPSTVFAFEQATNIKCKKG